MFLIIIVVLFPCFMCQMVACYVGLDTTSQNIVLFFRLDVHRQNLVNIGLFFYANIIGLECPSYKVSPPFQMLLSFHTTIWIVNIVYVWSLALQKCTKHLLPSLVSSKSLALVFVRHYCTPSTWRYALTKPAWKWNYYVVVV